MNKKKNLYRLIIPIAMIFISLTLTTSSSALASTPLTKTSFNSTAVITNSGSVNTCAYVIHVSLARNATYTCNNHQGQGSLSQTLTEKFFNDINAAQPLNALPHRMDCIKSKSFGTKTYIEYGTQKSPDVSCAVDPIGEKLANDVTAIKAALKFTTIVPRGMHQ